jgi:hypothetical protein
LIEGWVREDGINNSVPATREEPLPSRSEDGQGDGGASLPCAPGARWGGLADPCGGKEQSNFFSTIRRVLLQKGLLSGFLQFGHLN